MKFEEKTILEVRTLIKEKKISSENVAKYFLEKIKETNETLNTFLLVDEKGVVNRVENINKEGIGGSLMGIPCAIKDNILIKGIKTTAASKILQDYVASYDATVIGLLKESGAIFFRKNKFR